MYIVLLALEDRLPATGEPEAAPPKMGDMSLRTKQYNTANFYGKEICPCISLSNASSRGWPRYIDYLSPAIAACSIRTPLELCLRRAMSHLLCSYLY